MSDTIKGSIIGAVITGVISILIFILGNFSTKATLEKSTVITLSEYFDSIDKDMSYKEALQTVYEENKNANITIAELNEQINSFQNQIKEQNSIEEIMEIINSATAYWNNKEYSQALSVLKNSKTISEDIKVIYEQYSAEYCQYLLRQTDILISARNYDDAIKMLHDGSLLVTNNKDLKNRINEINNRPFALLSNLIPVSGEINGTWESGKRDNYGNSYTHGVCMHQSYQKASHVVYALDKKYTVLTGKFVLDEESKNTDGNYILYAYSLQNGNLTLIYESPILSTATRPIEVEIDVSNVMDLVLEVYDPKKSNKNANTGFVNAILE